MDFDLLTNGCQKSQNASRVILGTTLIFVLLFSQQTSENNVFTGLLTLGCKLFVMCSSWFVYFSFVASWTV